MKTKILITALMIAISTCVIAGTNHNKNEDSLFTLSLASIVGSISSESVAMSVLNNNSAELNPSAGSFKNAADLEEWIESRESWEQGNSESVNLEEWISQRESWEQESSELSQVSAVFFSSLLEEWIANCETWEQENYGPELTNSSIGSIQDEWISNREAWEQK